VSLSRGSKQPVSSSLRRAGLLLAAALPVAAGCSAESPREELIRPVRFQEVYATGGERLRTFSGAAQAGVESRLSFKVAGTVRRIRVKVGDRVRSGLLLAELDPRDYELQVEDAEAALAQARARARNAEATLDRVRGLYESNNASQADYDAARAERDSASATVSSGEKKLELARSQLSYTRLVAPVEGAISEVTAEVNENVSQGQTVVVLSSGSLPEVRVAIPEVFIARIREGQRVQVEMDALAGRQFPAVVTEVGVASSGTATTFPVTVRLESRPEGIRPGMAARVAFRIESGGERERILLPPFAVAEDRSGRFVFVVEPTGSGRGVVHRREVRTGQLTGDGLEILDGLRDGDLVVTAGVSRIEDGLEVLLPGAGTSGS
jgi:RND family efflux transporter MFP subunit